eukprot:2695896-Rhodomonas_salina.2
MHDLSERRKEKQRLPDASASDLRLASVDAESSGKAKCGSAMPVVRAIKPDGRLEEPAMSSVERDGDRSVTDALEKARAELYDARKVPAFFASAEDAKLSFLSHSFGRIPPMVHAASLKSLYQLYARPGKAVRRPGPSSSHLVFAFPFREDSSITRFRADKDH